MHIRHMNKTCPRCGATFECLHDTPRMMQCHCVGIHLTPGQLQWLKNHYNGCLCHECLIYVSELPV